jgi:hypothetical protein
MFAHNSVNLLNLVYRNLSKCLGGWEERLVAQISWGHIKVIIIKIKNIEEGSFCIQKTKEINLSRV